MKRLWRRLVGWRGKSAPVNPVAVLPVRVLTAPTLAQWRSDSAALDWTKALLADPTFQRWLSMVTASASSGWPVRGHPVDANAALVELGRREGYYDCLRVIAASAMPMQARQEELQPTYENTELNEDQNG